MPRYVYRCSSCEQEFEVFHSMGETLEECETCHSKGTIQRIPQITHTKKTINEEKPSGSVVKEFIEETKKSVKEEKRELKKEMKL